MSNKISLYPCEPTYWIFLPKSIRLILGWIYASLFSASFLSIPLALVLIVPGLWRNFPFIAFTILGFYTISFLLPVKEWNYWRKVGQLLFEVFNFKCNLSPEQQAKFIKSADSAQYVFCMHPHGIIPIHAIIFAAYQDLYLPSTFGFGAAADVTLYIPFLRNILSWVACGPCGYKTLLDGIIHGKCKMAPNRTPKNLFILPGGVAEVFLSTPGKNAIIFRQGLCRLSLETGAALVPMYAFGGTDFFSNLATGDNILSRFSRWLRAGLTIYWGQFLLPIPYVTDVTLCIGDPIAVDKWTGDGPIPDHLIKELHSKYINSIKKMFEDYKVAAGRSNAILEIM